MSDNNNTLLLHSAKQIVVVSNNQERYKAGSDQSKIAIIEDGCMVIDKQGRIVEIGGKELLDKYPAKLFSKVVDATGKCIIPGLVDAHTHPVWSGDRVHEFAMKLAGATYMEIHQKGGGIGFTVRHTKESSEEELEKLLLTRLDRMLKLGTTLTEAKSGYGLELETEVKMLRVIHKCSKSHPVELVANYCGAHSVPKGTTPEQQTRDIVEHQIPEIQKLMVKGEISPSLIDVFCEKNVFDIEQTKEILKAGEKIGLESNFHGDELSPIKAGELAGHIGALAMSHCEETSDEGILAMAKRPTVAVLLPTTAYILRLKPPPARKFIENKVPIALGSDFNPNAFCLSMPLVMNMACVNLHMTLEESLVAATINSAAALGKSKEYGSLEVGKFADFIVLDAPTWEHLIYQMVDPPIQSVFKKGTLVFHEGRIVK